MSESIVEKYVAIADSLREMHAAPKTQRDIAFENQSLQNRDELLYVDLCQTMNAGDVGRLEASFLPWIYLFVATGKHKYAAQMSQFWSNLLDVYPPDLSRIVRLNMLCNPTGKAGAFRGVDWLVERNNLYTKVYRNCHVIMETAFFLKNRTLGHTAPDATLLIEKLQAYLEETKVYTSTAGRSAHVIEDALITGLQLIQGKKISQQQDSDRDDEAPPEVTGDDLIA
ncbi:hypothetical protein CONPUDRAFT_78414 [Coniophora puteana RWD-64-598 SS2]|uniref:DUF6589 domain-containing protein n=1 Tax=Coniophora puteana (strain RWD-64-598) TaxID=741705 RepID=R7SCP7_CONPW|nr:uncharacterized protein CONPUDRAFT_78414 [Coniophora puteana RWD-64-598 SS2]EIW73941.1 hypothetical protein CONPUDRAFT_78414 [Coniophora puteana RWD-64-598 SS2]